MSGLPDIFCPDMSDFADSNIVSYGRIVDGTLDTSDKEKVIFFPVTDVKSFKEILNHIEGIGYKNVMIHVHGDELFDLALEVFKEVKNIKEKENMV